MQHYLVDVPIQTAYLNASQGQYSIIAGVPTFVGVSCIPFSIWYEMSSADIPVGFW